MADINIKPDIALGGKQDNSLANLGNLVQTVSGIQEFQKARELLPYAIEAGKAQSELARLQTEKAGYDTAKAKQENKERELKQQFFTDPENWQTNGRIDINKINKNLPAIAPLTHREDIDKLTALGEAQTKGIEAQSKMTTGFRTIVGNTLGILGRSGVKDAATYVSALNNLKGQYKDNKDVVDYIDSRLDILKHVPSNADVSKEALRESQSLLGPAEQEAQFAPKASTINTGMAVQPVVSQPAVGGNAPSITTTGKPIPLTIAPGQQATVEQDRNGNFMIVTRNNDGTVANSLPLPSGQNQPPAGQPAGRAGQPPAGQQPQAAYSSNMPPLRYPVRQQGEVVTNMQPQEKADLENNTKYRTDLSNQQNNMSTARRNLDEVMSTATDLKENSWFTSGGAGAVSRKFKDWAGDPTYKMLSKDLANVAISNIQALGGSMDTVAGQQLTKMANGDETYPPDVLVKIAKRTYADLTNVDMQAAGANAFANKYGESNLNSFKQAWAANADSKVFELINMYNAAESLEGKAKDKAMLEIKTFVGTGKPAEKMLQKYKNLKKLSETGEL